jgi:processive 1,2-diacylglycerol beta-glucosyltransferase
LISKSGGITVAESLAKELPMVVIAPIIGQETRNCDFLVSCGSALKVGAAEDLTALVEDLIAHPEKIERLRESVRRIRMPYACYEIAKLAAGSGGGGHE